MKNTFKVMPILLILTVLMGNCQKVDVIQNCKGDNAQQIETFYHDELENISCSLQNINVNDKVVNLVIKTKADYEKYFTCSTQLPTVDFEKYFILAGRYRHHQCAMLDNQQVLLCNNKIIYRVKMLKQVCDSFTDVFYLTVIERKYENMQIEFDVTFIN